MASEYKQKKLERYFSTCQVGMGIIMSQGCCGDSWDRARHELDLGYSQQKGFKCTLPITVKQLKISISSAKLQESLLSYRLFL